MGSTKAFQLYFSLQFMMMMMVWMSHLYQPFSIQDTQNANAREAGLFGQQRVD